MEKFLTSVSAHALIVSVRSIMEKTLASGSAHDVQRSQCRLRELPAPSTFGTLLHPPLVEVAVFEAFYNSKAGGQS